MTKLLFSLRFAACAALTYGSLWAADWQTFRGDGNRSAYTPDKLPTALSLRWVHKTRHSPRPAWSGRDTRMPFDAVFHPVVAGDRLFFGSSADGKVYALDTATGKEQWSFFTGGPIRFAPLVWQSKVFVASDDGFLYCLAAEGQGSWFGRRTGKLLWKMQGGPIESMLLGNDRMISRWPARGGPVIADGTLYFAAGIWPSEGIFLYALDAATGRKLWCKDSAGSIFMAQPHGGSYAKSGISAQGHLVVNGDQVLVPTGRAVPAAFGRADGKLRYFHLQKYSGHGGSSMVSAGPVFFHSNSVFNTATGHLELKGLSKGAHTKTPVVTPDHIVHATGKEIVALDRANMWMRKETVDRKGEKVVKKTLASPIWRAECPQDPAVSLIVAGDAVVVGGRSAVSVLQWDSGNVVFTAEVDGAPHGLAVAGGQLFVGTDRGTIYCFGAKRRRTARTVTPKAAKSPYLNNPVVVAAVEEIVTRSGLVEGYCLDLGCGDGALSYALAKRTQLRIYAVDSDPEKVALARERLDAAGLYGSQVTVHCADLGELPHPNYFADLIVSGRSVAGGQIPLSDTEMLRVLRPEGGIAIIGAPGAMRTTVRGPLDGAGTWTHQYCDPANTNCSPDTLARGPLGALWFTDFGFPMPSRHGRGPAPLYLKGRLFVEGLDALLCVNAYNGRQLWKYPLPGILKAYDQEHIMGASGTGSNFCVTPDAVFVRTGSKCLRIDPATGKLLSELSAPPKPDGKEGVWGYIASVDDTLFGTLSNTEHTVEFRWIRADMSTQFTESMLLFALDPITGKTKWVYTPEASIRNNTIAVGNGRVYLIDRAPAAFDRLDPRSTHVRARRGAKPFPTGKLVALDADTGRRVWTVDKAIYGTLLALSEEHDVLLMSYQDTAFKLISEQGGRMAAFKASTGEQLWDSKLAYKSRPILNGRTLYAQPGAWDLLTGERQDFEFRRYYGCGTLSGSKNLMLFRSGTLGYTDLLRPHGTENYGGVRPGCWINAITGGGIVLMPDASERCRCSYLIKTSLALHPYGIRPPAISPNGGSSAQPIRVKLSSEAGKADIRYTLDGSDPTRSSSEYLGPMPVPKTGTLRARAYSKGAPPSQVAEASFVIDPRIVPIDGTDWRVYETGPDRPQSSVWSLSSGVLTELSNFYRGDAANRDPAMERVGALRIYTPGANFADGELEVDIASSDNDGLGVAFRLSGHDRHYLWAMDQQRGFHILACKNGDSYRLLASKSKGYERNRWYRLRVTLEGARIRVYLDDELDLEATDTTFAKGTFALYAWGCKGAKFRSVRWKSRK